MNNIVSKNSITREMSVPEILDAWHHELSLPIFTERQEIERHLLYGRLNDQYRQQTGRDLIYHPQRYFD